MPNVSLAIIGIAHALALFAVPTLAVFSRLIGWQPGA